MTTFRKTYSKSSSTNNKYLINTLENLKQNVLFLVDWDDTLFPTAYTNWLEKHTPQKSPDQFMKIIENRVIRFLEEISKYGTFAIVTNSQEGWVKLSASNWMPGLLPYLDRLPIISARSIFEGRTNYAFKKLIELSGPNSTLVPSPLPSIKNKNGDENEDDDDDDNYGDDNDNDNKASITTFKTFLANPFIHETLKKIGSISREKLLTEYSENKSLQPTSTKIRQSISQHEQQQWKLLAFIMLVFRKQSLLNQYQHQNKNKNQNRHPLKIISIGDSIVERDALRKLVKFDFPSIAPIRTIKMCINPSPRDLISQLEQITSSIKQIVAADNALDIWMCPS
jgi:hypothetical protein